MYTLTLKKRIILYLFYLLYINTADRATDLAVLVIDSCFLICQKLWYDVNPSHFSQHKSRLINFSLIHLVTTYYLHTFSKSVTLFQEGLNGYVSIEILVIGYTRDQVAN